eukprot:1106780-Prymnesium_polylepis.1
MPSRPMRSSRARAWIARERASAGAGRHLGGIDAAPRRVRARWRRVQRGAKCARSGRVHARPAGADPREHHA